ncbi:hypothetical protein NL445_29320 [Klebsiella pneumoniae]|nr:hypothetical protein [Klebsiella pneumoniae]
MRSQNVQSVVVTSGPAPGGAAQKVMVVGGQPQHNQGQVSQAPVSVVAKPVFARGGGGPQPPPELDDLSHLA